MPCCRCRFCLRGINGDLSFWHTLPYPSSVDGVRRLAAGHACSNQVTTTISSNKQLCINSLATENRLKKTVDYCQIVARTNVQKRGFTTIAKLKDDPSYQETQREHGWTLAYCIFLDYLKSQKSSTRRLGTKEIATRTSSY